MSQLSEVFIKSATEYAKLYAWFDVEVMSIFEQVFNEITADWYQGNELVTHDDAVKILFSVNDYSVANDIRLLRQYCWSRINTECQSE